MYKINAMWMNFVSVSLGIVLVPCIRLRNFDIPQVVSARWISCASACSSQSSSTWISVRHEQGCNPLPFNQCWNMASQHSSGSPWYFPLMMSSWVPLSSKSRRTPNLRHLGDTLLMIWIFLPWAVLHTDSLESLRGASTLNSNYSDALWTLLIVDACCI